MNSDNSKFEWLTTILASEMKLESHLTSQTTLPKGGILVISESGTATGWLGFKKKEDDYCSIFCSMEFESSGLSEAVQKLLNQAVKSKFVFASLEDSILDHQKLKSEFEKLGFDSVSRTRRLVADAPTHLLAHLDWSGKVSSVSAGKGSESINQQLYEKIADGFPSSGKYSELQVNKILNELHTFGDASALRRELVDRGYLGRTRDCTAYWKIENPTIIKREG